MEINNYEDYLIYKDGRVYSKKRNIFIKLNKNIKGYLRGKLCKDGKHKPFLIHRLVAIHYIDNPENKPFVDHIDGIKSNNNIDNLRWTTNIENCNAFKTKYKNNKTGFKNIYCYNKKNKYWKYEKIIYGKQYSRYFKNKIDAICYKYIFILRMRAGHFT